MARFVKIGQTSDLAPGEGMSVEVDGEVIALFNVAGTFYAINDECTHDGGPLGEGELDGDVVACPWHGAEFNVRTGELLLPPADCDVRSYLVKVEGDDILVKLD